MAVSKAVLITGCSSGIGRATALASIRAGFPTYASARNITALADLVEAGCHPLELDVTDDASCSEAVKAIEAEHGAVGALVNNAGFTQVGPFEEVPLSDVQRQWDTNVLGPVRLCQLVLPGMRGQEHGTIVNLGSVAGLLTPPGGSTYSMSKYALEALSDAMRFEVKSFGVRVVLLEPGSVRTDLMHTGMTTMPPGEPGGPYEEFRANFNRMVAQAHKDSNPAIIEPEVVAKRIVKVIRAKNPKPRYRVGAQAHVAPVIRAMVSDRMWDSMMARQAPVQSRA